MNTTFNNNQKIAKGTILSASSYRGDIYYYQVVRATSNSCWIKEINKIDKSYNTFGNGACLPVKDSFKFNDCKPKMHRILNAGGEQCIKVSAYTTAYVWNGTIDYH